MRPIALVAMLLMSSTAAATPCAGSRALDVGTPAPCSGTLIGADRVAAVVRLRAALDECRRQVAAPLPQSCTPVVVEVPTRVQVVRVRWWPVVVAGVVGLAAGGSAVWMVTR